MFQKYIVCDSYLYRLPNCVGTAVTYKIPPDRVKPLLSEHDWTYHLTELDSVWLVYEFTGENVEWAHGPFELAEPHCALLLKSPFRGHEWMPKRPKPKVEEFQLTLVTYVPWEEGT